MEGGVSENGTDLFVLYFKGRDTQAGRVGGGEGGREGRTLA